MKVLCIHGVMNWRSCEYKWSSKIIMNKQIHEICNVYGNKLFQPSIHINFLVNSSFTVISSHYWRTANRDVNDLNKRADVKVNLIVPRAPTGRWNGRIGIGIFKTLIVTFVDTILKILLSRLLIALTELL